MSAVFSPDRVYRYRLDREIDHFNHKRLCFVLLNPSTADEFTDDPTIRRCRGYAAKWDFGRLTIVNLFALRSTDPKVLQHAPKPVGPDNDAYIRRAAIESNLVVVAWGNHGAIGARNSEVGAILKAAGIPTLALGVTKQGEPAHPLYLRREAEPKPYPTAGFGR